MSQNRQIAIIRTGTANLASVRAAFNRLNVPSCIVGSPSELRVGDPLVLPGVGSFQHGMAAIRERKWEAVIRQRLEEDLPTLAICLGLQLLCLSSDENPGVAGLGLLPVTVARLPSNVSVPQFGWNRIQSQGDFLDGGYVFYANSYCLSDIASLSECGWEVATSRHGIDIVAAVRKGRFWACQFHPELSGRFGQDLLSRWLRDAMDQPCIEADNQENSLC